MEEQMVKLVWVGPTGDNSEIGSVVRGEEKEMTADQADHFKSLKLAKDIVVKDTSSKKKFK